MREVSRRWRYPQRRPPGALSSCTSCCPTGGAGHMAKSGTDQHKGGVAVWETAQHTSAATALPVQPFNGVIGTDAGPMFTG